MSTSTQEAGNMAASSVPDQIIDGDQTLEELIDQKVDQRVAEKTAEIRQEFEDELAKKDSQIQALANELEKRPKIRMDGKTIQDIEVGDKANGNYIPLGRVVSGNREDINDVEDRVHDLERGEVNVADVIDGGASDSSLQISRWRADVTDADHPDDVSGLTANQARATELWKYFPKLSDTSHGKRKLQRSDATKIFRNLSDYDLPSDRNTVNRCMRFMARATGTTDDEENDDHLVTFQPGDEGSESVLVADQDDWEAFVADITGVDTPDRDSKGDALDVAASSGENGESKPSADDATQHVVEDSGTDDNGMDDRPCAGEL